MRLFIVAMPIVFLIVSAGIGDARDQPPKEEKRFSNQTSFSLVNTTGNTDPLSLSGENEMAYAFSERWSSSWLLGAIYKETDGEKESERYYSDIRKEE